MNRMIGGAAIGCGVALLAGVPAAIVPFALLGGFIGRITRDSTAGSGAAGSSVPKSGEAEGPIRSAGGPPPVAPEGVGSDRLDFDARARAIREFLGDASLRGVISADTRRRLESHADAYLGRRAEEPVGIEPRGWAEPETPQAPPPPVQAPLVTPQREPETEPSPVDAVRPPSRSAVSDPIADLLDTVGRGWKAFTTDVAVHSITYLGVLLLVVVIFVFFAFGYFGDLVETENLRPVVEAALPLTLFGMAWLLRNRTGIQFTANAVGLIAALILPIMLAASFRDGSTCCPPDVDGPARWLAYAGVGLAVAVLYGFLAVRRSPMYSYLVGPSLWLGAGALGLYTDDLLRLLDDRGLSALGSLSSGDFASDGIAGVQMVTVMVAVILTLLVMGALRRTTFGGVVAVPTVRVGAVAMASLAGVAIYFAHSDAVGRGVADPTFDDLAGTVVAACAVGALGFLVARRSQYAWEGLGPRLRAWLMPILDGLALTLAAAAWVATTGLGMPLGWVGVGLVVAAIVLMGVTSRAGESVGTLVWAARVAGVAGLVLSFDDPYPAMAAWGACSALMICRERSTWLRSLTAPAIPRIADRMGAAVAVAVPVLVTVGAGGAASWERGTPWVLAGSALLLVLARFLSDRWGVVGLLAGLPAWLTAAAGLTVGLQQVAGDGPLSDLGLGWLLILLAGVPALALGSWLARVPAATALATSGGVILLRRVFEDAELSRQLADVIVLGSVGVVLFSISLVRSRRELSVAAGAVAHPAVYAAVVLGWGHENALLASLVIVGLTHAVEAFLTERDQVPLIAALSGRAGPWRRGIEDAPAVVAATTVPFVAVLAGRQWSGVRTERARSGLVLAATAWFYVAGFIGTRAHRLRWVMTAGVIAVSAAGIAVAAPSLVGLLWAIGSATAALGALSWLMRRPAMSVAPWLLAVVFGLLLAVRLDLVTRDLHFVLMIVGVVMALGAVISGRRAADGEHGTVSVAPWSQPPLAIGLLLMPAATAFAIADGRLLGLLAMSGAAVYAMLGVALRSGGLAVMVAGMTAIGYTHLIEAWRSPFEEPIVWMPLAAAFMISAAVAPRHERASPLVHAAPGLIASWLALMTLACLVAVREGSVDWVLLTASLLLFSYSALRRSLLFSYAGMAAGLLSGVAFGWGWFALASAAAGAAVAVHATLRHDAVARNVMVPAAALLWAGAFAALAVWAGWSPRRTLVITGMAAAVLAAPVVAMHLRAVAVKARMWLPAGHGLVQAGAGAVVSLVGVAGLSAAEISGVLSLLLVGEALVVGFLAEAVPEPWRFREGAAVLGVAAGVLGAFAFEAESAQVVIAHVLAGAGAAAFTLAAWRKLGSWTTAAVILAAGLGGAGIAVTAGLRGIDSVAAATVLIIVGAGLTAAGVVGGWRLSIYSGFLVWLAAAFILGGDALEGNKHAYVVSTAVVLLLIIEMERRRHRKAGRVPPDELRWLEWLFMLAPLVVAAADILSAAGYALLLGVEGVVLLIWGLVTRVRRRLLAGAAAITIAALAPVALVAADRFRQGVSGGVYLIIGASLAVLLILIGSLIERGRVRIGDAVGRISEALEDWE